jgi:DNA primase
MVQLLWQRETEGRDFDSPERKAALDKVLREKIKLIRDPSIKSHYGQAVKELRWQLFNPHRRGGQGQRRSGKWHPTPAARASTKTSLLVAAGDEVRTQMREAVILAALVCCPELCEEFEDALEGMECSDPDHIRLRDLILRHAPDEAGLLHEKIEAQLGADTLERLFSRPHVALTPAVRRHGDAEAARMTVAEELAKLKAEAGWTAEMSEASEEIAGVADEAVTWRLGQAAETRNRAQRSQQEDKAEYEVGDNGARISRDERDAFEALLERIRYSKSGH